VRFAFESTKKREYIGEAGGKMPDHSQRATPSCFSMSSIIGCVKPALRN
jgi:hypothetical protein